MEVMVLFPVVGGGWGGGGRLERREAVLCGEGCDVFGERGGGVGGTGSEGVNVIARVGEGVSTG
jgi:hypothetical protein